MQGNDAFRLIVRRGPQPNQVYELTSEVTNLGRDITNDIVINDREVSRHHLRYMRGADGFTIEDLGSTNGTFVNGKRVTGATPLKNGDMVGLGETVTLQFEVVRPGAAQPVQPAQPAQPAQPSYQPPPQQLSYTPPAEEDRYKPQQPAQAQVNPYQPQPAQPTYQPPPQQQPAYAASQPDYAQPAADPYGSGNAAQAAYGPPPPGYDYDPYAMRDEEGGNSMQWFLIGCLGLLLLCCCMTVVLAVAVDTFCMYDSVPGLTNILNAIGLSPSC